MNQSQNPESQNSPSPYLAPVLGVLRALADAWNAGDGDAYGAVFTDDATYVTFAGDVLRGAPQIAKVHGFLFDGPLKGFRMEIPGGEGADVPYVREPAPGVLHVVTAGAVRQEGEQAPAAGEPDDRASVQSYLLVRDADGPEGWRIAAFHNTRRSGS